MKRGLFLVIAAGLTASSAMGSNLNISVQQTNGTNAITVAPGAIVSYKVMGRLGDDLNEGLALIGLSLDFTGGPLTAANTPPDGNFTCSNPMRNFVQPEGMGNPAGYGGTIVPGTVPPGAGDIIQAGGAQNTINNTAINALFPVGAVLKGVAQPAGCGTAELLTGSLTAPASAGVYQLCVINTGPNAAFANVITDGETGEVFYATEAAAIGAACVGPAVFPTCSQFCLAVTVTASCAAPSVTQWESVASHLPNYVPGDIALVIPADATPGTTNDSPFSEPRTSVTKLVVTFSGDINPATAAPGNVIVTGRDSAQNLLNLGTIVVGASATASNQLTITFAPALPDFAKYRVRLDGVEASCGPQEVVGGIERIFTALRGDATNDRRVNAIDLSKVRSLVITDPIVPPNTDHIRSDVNDDGRVNASDLSFVRARANASPDARLIEDP